MPSVLPISLRLIPCWCKPLRETPLLPRLGQILGAGLRASRPPFSLLAFPIPPTLSVLGDEDLHLLLFAGRDAKHVDDPLGRRSVPGISLLAIPLHLVAHARGDSAPRLSGELSCGPRP